MAEKVIIDKEKVSKMIQFIAARYCLDVLEVIITDLSNDDLLVVLENLGARLLEAFFNDK